MPRTHLELPTHPSMRRFTRLVTSCVRRAGAVLAAATLLLASPAGAALAAPADDPAAAQAAREIQAARDRANAAAQAMFDAESRLDALDVDIGRAEAELTAVEAEATAMRTSLQQDAQRSFVKSGSAMPLLIDMQHANDALAANRFASVARGAAAVELDDFAAVMKDVDHRRSQLERQKEQTAAARDDYERLKGAAESEMVRLAEIEEQRLKDVAVQRELERQRREKLDQERAEAARLAAAATTTAPAASASSESGSSSTAASSAGAASAAPAQQASAPAPAPAVTPAPAPAPAPPSPPPSNAGSGIVCPIAGPRAFGDTWGAGRSGGRSHEGVDMMSPAGTPLVAVESGYAQFKTTRLGGNSIWVNGNSGTRYFYAHLSAWEGSSRNVSQGEVIGYVGATGNTSANHLHFEVHPGGGRAVNPYPYVRAVC